MSKTVDQLMVVYDLAFGDAVNATESWDQAIGHRAGIAAVVRALRDELTKLGTLEFHDGWTVLRKFNEILGDAGKKVAGGPRPEAMGSTPPATDPAPDVCVWTASSASGLFSARCQPHNASVRPVDNCHLCGRPVKFTEAKT